MQRARRSAFAAYRLNNDLRAQVPRFVEEMKRFLGRPCESRYQIDNEFIYCSELLWKGLKNPTGEKMGKLVKLGDLNWKPYKKTIRRYEQGPPPVGRKVITPKDLSEAPRLRKAYSGGL